MKFHTSLPMANVKETKEFYSVLFDSNPVKEKEDYLKFLPENIDLNISFVLSDESPAKLHLGFEAKNAEELDLIFNRLKNSGLLKSSNKNREVSGCCYSKQDKFWVSDPNGHEWEVYISLEDTEKFSDESIGSCCSAVEDGDLKSSKCC